MLSSIRFFRFSVLVLLVGMSLYSIRAKISEKNVVSTDDYWGATGLTAEPLEELLQPRTCVSSERYFLACANSLLNMANRFNLGLNDRGELVSIKESLSKDMSSEKTQLEPWKKLFNEKHETAAKISFLAIWNELKADHVKSSQQAMIVGVGLNGFISVFRDPHTYFMPVAQFKEVISKTDSRSTSLGLILGVSEKGEYVVKKTTEGSPAKISGILKGDVLLSIDGVATQDLVQARISEMLKGEVGDKTKLVLRRGEENLKFKLFRKEITVATVSTRVIDGLKPIGVVGVNKFAKGACGKVRDSLILLKRTHIRGLLLDLRDNPGGQMEEAACIASLFVGPEKRIFEIRYLDRSKKAEAYYGGEEKIFDLPLAILVNGSSASASEIVAGSLRDLGRAVLVGEKTFGKGSFQEGEYWSLNNNIALFETKGFYYLPSGRSPQMKGLEPDVLVNFDQIKTIREDDQFVNPLRAPERQIRLLSKAYSTEECIGSEDESLKDDLQLSKAQQVLFCTKTVARAGI